MFERTASLVLALALSGCATVFQGTHQDVFVITDAPRVLADGAPVGGGRVALRRGEDHVLTAEAPGRIPVSTDVRRRVSWLYAVLDGLVAVFFFPIGLVAPIVDLVDGAIWNLEPEHVYLPHPAEAPTRF